jgi:dTDP-glucose 4,6-dehydratase
MRILVTGGCGFIGSNFILRCFEKFQNVSIINLDAMVIGSNPLNLTELKNSKYKFVKGNICNKQLLEKLIPKVDHIVNFAAESHVDRSIVDPKDFIKSNYLGVCNILEVLRNHKKIKLLHISTDEVYGEILKGRHAENDEMNPSNPYSATKASAETMIRAYSRTYDLDTTVTRATNNFGPRQFPEKLIPSTILSALKNETMQLHGNGSYKRQWIYVNDHCDALLKILKKWKSSSVYNIAGNNEVSNLNIVKKIMKIMNKDELISFGPDRPGQDRRYAINGTRLQKKTGFQAKTDLNEALKQTIQWYIDNKKWRKKISFKKISSTPWLKN